MIGTLMRTDTGGRIVEFMISDKGKSIDKFLVRHCDYSLMMFVFSARAGFPPIPVLMLYTVGRKSGRERSVVMPFFAINETIYVIGSNGAATSDPQWVQNLRVNPKSRVVIHRRETQSLAREVVPDSDEYQSIWAHAREATPQYAAYQSNTTRKIPIIALELWAS